MFFEFDVLGTPQKSKAYWNFTTYKRYGGY